VDQPNLPGTTDEYPNWRMRLRLSLEDIAGDPRIAQIAGILRARAGKAERVSS
jgi:4-alpha-glucanotransferase